MPIRHRRISKPHPQAQGLLKSLISEWRKPHDNLPEPVIIEEGGARSQPIHVFVIWSKWEGLDQRERSEIIMDAFGKVRGASKSLLVTVAMGLTQEEAERMNMGYE